MRKCQGPTWTLNSCRSAFRSRPYQKRRDRRGESLPGPEKEAHAICSLFPLLALLCWPRKDKGHFQADFIFGRNLMLTSTDVGGGEPRHPLLCTTYLIATCAPSLAESCATAQSTVLTLPASTVNVSSLNHSLQTEKCGSCIHKPICS